MKVLVSGSFGYIGGYTVKALQAAGHEVEYMYQQAEAIIHLGALIEVAESVRDPRIYFESNVWGSLKLMNAALEKKIKYFVFASSAATSGSPYAEGKQFIEKALFAYDHAYGLKSVSLRYFNVAGGCENHNPETHLIPNILRAAKRGIPFVIYGNGSCVRDFVHVEDVAEANVKALHYLIAGGSTRVLDIGTGQGYTVLEVLNRCREITGKEIQTMCAPNRSGDVRKLVANTKAAEEAIGWKSSRSLDDIIRSAWEAIR